MKWSNINGDCHRRMEWRLPRRRPKPVKEIGEFQAAARQKVKAALEE